MKTLCSLVLVALASMCFHGCVHEQSSGKDPIVHPTDEQVNSAENEATISPAFVPWWVED